MSTFDAEDNKREIIIVKRRADDDDHAHHGGVWKIAFADFMTAMMCFFLVMWLINATDEQTKASIASYFNPMTLVDAAPSSKGLDDPGESTPARDNMEIEAQKAADEPINTQDEKSGPGENAHSVDNSETEKTSDEHLFSDPYAVLAEIAAQTATLQNISAKGDGGAQTSGPATGAQGGESYRDPFAPDFWSQEVASSEDEELDVFRQEEEGGTPADPQVAEAGQPSDAEATPAAEEEVEVAAAARDAVSAEVPEAPEVSEQPEAIAQETQQLAEEIRQEIMDAFGRDSELNRTISVVARNDGVLISVTDELNYGMFEIGSAVPKGELVLAMEQIGNTLNEHAGKIRINGHTDGRPFRGEAYDNWRLSTARAHSAYYMLARAGMDENRIKEVAGFADRELKVPEDPLADANRRIEIFLEAGG